jgi:quercetin dioxygenase-like cupin family protein
VSGFFEDERGTINDLFGGEPVAVTSIRTRKGAIRGNHLHRETTQWTMVLTGRLQIISGTRDYTAVPGVIITHYPGEPHAWQAQEDTECLVFTKGPRSGEDYESDTYRLDEPLLT